MAILVHTDGGCRQTRGGWAYSIVHGNGLIEERSGSQQDTTNNRMELTAAIEALTAIAPGQMVIISSDSQYVVKGVMEWSPKWIKNHWRTANGKDVLNRDLWERLMQMVQQHNVKFVWVRGHNGDAQNERVDQLATAAINACP